MHKRKVTLTYKEWYMILTGEQPLPDRMVLSEPCKNGHEINGKTLRITEKGRIGRCVFCSRGRVLNQRARRLAKKDGAEHKEALNEFERIEEERLLKKEIGDIYDEQ